MTVQNWTGKVVLVTGGAKGIGAVIARRFARAGARVIINCFHSYDQGKELAAEAMSEGLDMTVHRGSVARPEQVEQMFKRVEEDFGRLDVLVNNAAYGVFKDTDSTTAEDLGRSFEVNIAGALSCAQASRNLLAATGGCIVNLSSIGAGMTVGNYTSVGTSKAAVEALTRYMAAEWAQYGIRVNCASGGLIAGGVADAFPSAESMQSVVADATPLGGLGSPEDIAAVVEFLASPHARWITGQVLLADGGMSLGGAMLTPSGDWGARVAQARNDYRAAGKSSGELLDHVEPTANDSSSSPQEPEGNGEENTIVVVGMGLVVPGASSPEEFWTVLEEGPDLLTQDRSDRIHAHHFYAADPSAEDKTYQIASGYSDEYTPGPELSAELGADRRATDYTTQWFRHALRDALKGVQVTGRVSCTVGYTADGNQHLEEALVVESFIEDLGDAMERIGQPRPEAARVREALSESYPLYKSSGRAPLGFEVGHDAIRGLLGDEPEVTMLDTACSSSLYALDIAVKGLLDGSRDVAVCGGTFSVGPRNAVLFAKLHGLSPSGDLRPLDERADGVLFADGAAAVVLKRLGDARRDGDKILGCIGGIGMSSDGKGKAIYAPNVKGQSLAVRRAAQQRRSDQIPDWVVAHATGTPAGDLCEVTSVREAYGASERTWLTSNKSLIGHTGWAAGVVSLIQVLLSLQHETILPQHRFTRAPEFYQLEGTSLAVPTEPVPWPKNDTERTAAVSGFGFGGTNAHLVVQDVPVPFGREAIDDDIVLTAWSADLPGLKTREEIEAWACGQVQAEPSFGAQYDTNDLGVRMPPRVLRTLDRAQLMALRCARDLREQLGTENWERLHERIGVYVGSMGPTRNAAMYARRCHLDSVLDALTTADPDMAHSARGALTDAVRAGAVASNEDSFPGIMPNIVSARISNMFNTNGPNMVLDTGAGSALTALDVAADYLRAGEIDVAVAGGINGNSTAVFKNILERTLDRPVELHEGAFLFTLMRRSTATELGAEPLAALGDVRHGLACDEAVDGAPADSSAAGFGQEDAVFFAGAEGGRRVLCSLLQQCGAVTETVSNGPEYPSISLELSIFRGIDDDEQPVVSRYDRVWTPCPLGPLKDSDNSLSKATLDGRVVITSHLDMSVQLGRDGGTVLCTETVDTGQFDGAVAQHVRVVVDLARLCPEGDPLPEQEERLGALHDVMFLAAKQQDEAAAGSYGVVVLGAWDGRTPHPMAGLFTGFAKSLALEGRSRGLTVRAVLCDAREPAGGLQLLETELAHEVHGLPTAAWYGAVRSRESAVPVQRHAGDDGGGLSRSSVVLATAGGKGITSEIARAVSRRAGCEMYLLGSTDLGACRQQLDELGGPSALTDKAAFIRRARNSGDKTKVAEITAQFDRLSGAAEILRNLEELEATSGVGRVHYLQADVADMQQVRRAVEVIREGHQDVDMVIHGAGINRASTVHTKTLEQFQAVRQVKIGGYLALRRALIEAFGAAPRMWCSFSSLIGLTGQQGETDYASANDALTTLAQAHREAGQDEFAIGWTLWKETGMASSDLHQSFFSGIMGDVLTLMSSAEGIQKFLDELDAQPRTGAVVHIGAVEERSIEEAAPGFFTAPPEPEVQPAEPAPSSGLSPAFYVDRVERVSTDVVVCHRVLNDRDRFLNGHVVGGVGTLPGCFVLELVAEACRELRPGLVLTGARDVVFESFLRIDGPASRHPLEIRASVRSSQPDLTVVDVRISTQLVTPSGRDLHQEKVFFTAVAHLAPLHPPIPEHEPWPEANETPVLDPYHGEGSPVALSREFVSTERTRLHPLGKRATYRGAVQPGGPYDKFLTPVLLMDGLIRLAVLDSYDQPALPVAAPTRIGRVDFYSPANDVELTREGGPVELYSTPRGLGLGHEAVFRAVTPGGHVLLSIAGVEGVVVGHVDSRTGYPVPDPVTPLVAVPDTARRVAL